MANFILLVSPFFDFYNFLYQIYLPLIVLLYMLILCYYFVNSLNLIFVDKNIGSKLKMRRWYYLPSFYIEELSHSFRPQKFKSHSHHIIPQYNYKNIEVDRNSVWGNFFLIIDRQLGYVPFYYSLIISIASLLLLMFIFLQKKTLIVEPLNSNFYFFPKNSDIFFLYYTTLFFYIVLLVHSIFKFLMHVFDEVRCHNIYTKSVEKQSLLGISLFIISEAMLFFSFFWAFFHSSLSPSIFVGNCWPPLGITTLNPWHIPFLNTAILLISGVTVNWFFFTIKRLMYMVYKPQSVTGFSCHVTFKFIKMALFNFYFFKLQSKSFGDKTVNLFNNFNNLLGPIFLYYYSFFNLMLNLNLVFNNAYENSKLSHNFLIGYNIILIKHYWYSISDVFKSLFLFIYFLSNSIVSFNVSIFLFNFWNSCFDEFHFFKLYLARSFENVYISLLVTIYLGFLFLGFQYIEYKYYAGFDLSNIYGTVFYMLTSLHGLHVYVGLLSLISCYSFFLSFNIRLSDLNKGSLSNFLIVFSVWYWHFVDVVWLFLFIVIYLWGS